MGDCHYTQRDCYERKFHLRVVDSETTADTDPPRVYVQFPAEHDLKTVFTPALTFCEMLKEMGAIIAFYVALAIIIKVCILKCRCCGNVRTTY